MQGRILFVTGAALGYVLGARAGRRRYDQIKSAADRVWNDKNVQKSVNDVVGQVQGFVKEKAPEVQGAVVGQAKKVAAKVKKSDDDGVPSPSI
jgi:oxygen-dependent protoporphyrinogen oxidase